MDIKGKKATPDFTFMFPYHQLRVALAPYITLLTNLTL